jgi:hypothetical protein
MNKFAQNQTTIEFIAAFRSIAVIATSFFTTSAKTGHSSIRNDRRIAVFRPWAVLSEHGSCRTDAPGAFCRTSAASLCCVSPMHMT